MAYIACRAPLSMGLSRQEYWNGLPFPPPGDLPDPGIKQVYPALQVDSFPADHQGIQFLASEALGVGIQASVVSFPSVPCNKYAI